MIPWKIRKNRFDRIYIHNLRFATLFLLIFSLNKVVAIDHNHSHRLYAKSRFMWSLKLKLLSRLREVSVVSDHLTKYYPELSNVKTRVISTYMPPTQDEIERANIPNYVSAFIAGSKFVVSSAWRLVFEDGIDLYGFDKVLDIALMSKNKGLDVKYVLCLGDCDFNEKYFRDLKRRVVCEGLNDYVCFWENCQEAWALFNYKNCLYFRPTLTDGNSVSIHEANFFGTKVLASDVVPRPKFVNIYSYNNSDDAFHKIRVLLNV